MDFLNIIVSAVMISTLQTQPLMQPCGFNASELEMGLLQGLKPYADEFIKAEEETGINAVFLASVAALESGWATSYIAKSKNNLYGWTGENGIVYFDSKEICIDSVAKTLKENYLSEDGIHFNGYTVDDVNKKYNGRKEWADNVIMIMDEIEQRIEVNFFEKKQ